MSSNKRSLTESPGNSTAATNAKRGRLANELPKFPVSTLEDLDINLLRFQNKKLAERLDVRHKVELDLKYRIEQLEKKQTSSELIVYVINRYWNQLNEDLRVLLQRFDFETSDESEKSNECEATTSFLAQLSNWDKDELEENLQKRVYTSTRQVGKVLQAFDRIVQRNEKITLALKGESGTNGTVDSAPTLDNAVLEANIELQNENKNLHALVTSLHEKHHKISLKCAEFKDKVDVLDSENEELKLRIDEIEYELNRTRSRELRLEEHLHEAKEKLRDFQNTSTESDVKSTTAQHLPGKRDSVSQAKLDECQHYLEIERELAATRMTELEELNNQHKEALKEVERLKMELQTLPDYVIVETVEYKCLQSHFSVLYNESMQLKTHLEESRAMIQNAKTAHLRQIEHMESEELSMQKRLRTEVIQLEDQLAQVRKEYEMLRIEFEQTLAANEQTAPINREMRHLITSLQNHNQQLKGEVLRYKRRLKDSNHELIKYKHQIEQMNQNVKQEHNASTDGSGECKNKRADAECNVNVKEEPVDKKPDVNNIDSSTIVKVEKEESKTHSTLPHSSSASASSSLSSSTQQKLNLSNNQIKREPGESESTHSNTTATLTATTNTLSSSTSTSSVNTIEKVEIKKQDADQIIKDLKTQLKKQSEQYKEMKLLLDMYKTAPKEVRDKAQILTSERKYRIECDELRKQVAKYQELNRRKLTDDDALREINKLKEINQQLQKGLAAQKQEDEALLNEMEVTGNAFEDMKEQNVRLIQQLREKDDANFKLMSERIKSQQIQKLLKEENESLREQIISLQSQVEAQNQVVRKLEEKERLLQNNLSTVEKELSMRQQAMELHKRKAIESAQSAADLKLHLDKYSAQLKEAQNTVAEKTADLQESIFKTRRLQEDLMINKRQADRAKMYELATTADEVLLEEIKDYKAQLTCPSCKTKRKDAVLTKCFHVFCFDCLKTRYETRQRKCPECNALFGANDFHRLYLS